MADFVRTIDPSLGDNTPCDAHRLPPGRTGEVIKPGPVYLNANGKWYQSTGAANNAAAKIHGWAIMDYPNINGAITPYVDIMLPWGPPSATPGTPLYLSATKGELDTAPTTGGLLPCAYVVGVRGSESPPHAQIRCQQIY